MENFEEYQAWCFTKHIFFYAYTKDSPIGFCRIVKYVGSVPTKGQKDFAVAIAETKINELYRQVYLNNNQLTA